MPSSGPEVSDGEYLSLHNAVAYNLRFRQKTRKQHMRQEAQGIRPIDKKGQL